LVQFTLKNLLGITGKMNEHDAGKVGNKLANAVLLLVAGAIVVALLHVIRWW